MKIGFLIFEKSQIKDLKLSYREKDLLKSLSEDITFFGKKCTIIKKYYFENYDFLSSYREEEQEEHEEEHEEIKSDGDNDVDKILNSLEGPSKTNSISHRILDGNFEEDNDFETEAAWEMLEKKILSIPKDKIITVEDYYD